MDTVATPPTLPTMVLPKPVEGFRFDKTEKGWTLVENTPIEGEPTLMLDTFLREGEQSVVGRTMIERAKAGAEEKVALALVNSTPNGCLSIRTKYPSNGGNSIWCSLAPFGVIRAVTSMSRICTGAVAGGASAGAVSTAAGAAPFAWCASASNFGSWAFGSFGSFAPWAPTSTSAWQKCWAGAFF